MLQSNFFFNIKQLLRIGIYSNTKIQKSNSYVNKLFLGLRGNVPIFHYDMLIEYFHLIRIFILNLLRNKGNLLFYDDSARLENILPFYTSLFGQQYVLGRWVPGTLTNFRTIHYNFINKDSFLLAKYPTAIFYFNEKDNDVLLKECYKFNIPILSIVDFNTSSLFYYTYIIPGHRESYKFTVFIFYLLHYYLKKYSFFFYKEKKKQSRIQLIQQRNSKLFRTYYDVMLHALKMQPIYENKMALPRVRRYTKKRWKKLLYLFFTNN